MTEIIKNVRELVVYRKAFDAAMNKKMEDRRWKMEETAMTPSKKGRR
jgi:hypothetical protein